MEIGSTPPTAEPRAATLADHLESDFFKRHLETVLPKHLTSERFASVAMRSLAKTPKLKDCTLRSVMGGIMEAAVLGLEIDTQGEAWLIPYNVSHKGADDRWTKTLEAQLQVGVWGHMKLAHQSGRISGVQIDVKMVGEKWSFQKGTNGHLLHEPGEDRDLDDVDRIEWVYAVIGTDGWVPIGDGRTEVQRPGLYFDAFPKSWIERIRKSAQSSDSPAWENWYAEQAMAKCLKRVLKVCPKSREMARAITMTDELDAGVGQTWDVDTSLLLPADAAVDSKTQAARDAMRGMGDSPSREPEPVEVPAAQDPAPGFVMEERQPDPPPGREEQPDQPQGGAPGGGFGWR